MKSEKVILFPFDPTLSFFEGYAWATALARRINARFQVLGVKSPDQSEGSSVKDTYHALLEATGYFLQHYAEPNSRSKVSRPLFESVPGDPENEIISFLELHPIDILILDPSSLPTSVDLSEIVQKARSAFILPKEKTSATTRRFELVLEESAHFNIPNELIEEFKC